MKQRLIVCCWMVLLVTIVFFPITRTHTISGAGQVLTIDREKLGNCNLSIKIEETKSIFFCYRKQFSFVLDGTSFSEFSAPAYTKSEDGLCLISQMYFDEKENRMTLCSLVYDEDLSYAVIRWNEKQYFISSGSGISSSEIPVHKIK